MEYERPEEPDFFIKPPASLLAHGEPIRYPEWTDELTYAGELVAVIDERCRDVEPADVPEIVRGYTHYERHGRARPAGRTDARVRHSTAPVRSVRGSRPTWTRRASISRRPSAGSSGRTPTPN